MRIGPLTITPAIRCERCGEASPADAAFCIGCGAALPGAAGPFTGETQPLDPDDLNELDTPSDQASRIARALGVPRPLLVGGVAALATAVALSSLHALLAGLEPATIFEGITICLGG